MQTAFPAQSAIKAPAKSMANMHQVVLNDRINAVLCCAFILVVACILVYGVRACRAALRDPEWTAQEAPAYLAAAK